MNDTIRSTAPYLSDIQWRSQRPRSLVICCSDGRLQKSIDEFLHSRLGVDDYDRLYAPGGPAVLADSGSEYVRANLYRRDLEFLFKAHQIEQAVLIFHGGTDDGAEEHACAHYRRIMPGASNAELTQRQIADASEIMRTLVTVAPDVQVQMFRAEVQADRRVKFLPVMQSTPRP